MPAYFANESRAFTPRGYLGVCQAIIRCAVKWHDIDLSRFIEVSCWSPEDYDINSDDGLRGHENFLLQTWAKLRQYLYDETVTTKVISTTTGQVVDLPTHVWGSSKADTILTDGNIGEFGQNSDYDGRAILSEIDLLCLLNNKAKPAVGGPPQQSLAILAPADPETLSAYLPLGMIGIREVQKAFLDKLKASTPIPEALEERINHRQKLYTEASREACLHLASGALRSFHRAMSGGTVRPLKPSDWLADGTIYKSVVIGNHGKNHWSGWIDRIVVNSDGVGVLGAVIVNADNLIAVLRGDPATNQTAIISNGHSEDSKVLSLPDRGGRPPVHDSEAFLLEAFRIAYLDGAPSTMAELMTRTSRAYQDARRTLSGSNRPPRETWMKERLRPVWKIIEEGRKGR